MKNRVIIIAIYLGLAVAGYWALLRTPIDAIPDLSDTQVIVFSRCSLLYRVRVTVRISVVHSGT